MNTRNLSRIIRDLIDFASRDIWLSPGKRRVGFIIEHLDAKDREVLKTATAKDFNGRIEKDRLPSM